MENIEVAFGDVKKCAIFVHYSIDDVNRVEQIKKRLEEFCKETLKCNNYEFFIEIGSFEGDRTVFNEMLNKFSEQEFSHLLVSNIGQIYKLTYDMDKAIDLTDKIQAMNVTIISVDEKRIIEGIEKLKERREKVIDFTLYDRAEERSRIIKQGKISRKCLNNIDSTHTESVSQIKTKIDQIKHEPIITEKEWERIQNKLKNDLK